MPLFALPGYVQLSQAAPCYDGLEKAPNHAALSLAVPTCSNALIGLCGLHSMSKRYPVERHRACGHAKMQGDWVQQHSTVLRMAMRVLWQTWLGARPLHNWDLRSFCQR